MKKIYSLIKNILSGRAVGTARTETVKKQVYLPRAENDTVFAVLYEKTDIVWLVAAVVMAVVIIMRIMRRNKR